MESFFIFLEDSSLPAWIREGGTLTGYPLVLFLHTLGLSVLVGLNLTLDFRILGLGPGIPLKSLLRAFPLMWAGFALNAATGFLLFAADARRHFANPAFLVKLACVAAAMVLLTQLRNKVFRTADVDGGSVGGAGRILAAVSLAAWFVALSAGRLMAYINEFIL